MATTADRRRALGEYGERLAARHLAARGMVLLDRNWRCPEGELDLVLLDGAVVVAVEVKTRRSHDHGSPLEAVTPTKAERLARLAWRWVVEHEVRSDGVRVDLVGVLRPRHGDAVVEHVRGVC